MVIFGMVAGGFFDNPNTTKLFFGVYFIGFIVAFISLVVFIISETINAGKSVVNTSAGVIKKKDAHRELLKCKELFDVGILTKGEYDMKVAELKKAIM